MKKLGASADYREESGEFLCDGIKLLEEAVISGAEISVVLTSAHLPFPLSVDTRVYFAERGLIDSLSPLQHSQDTLFSCRKQPPHDFVYTGGTHILLDGMQDPGNVGTIIRTANAFGMHSLILTGNYADPYNPKTIRASMGAIFRQKIFRMKISDLAALRENGAEFIGAAFGRDCTDVSSADLKEKIIAIGSEGRGLSEKVLDLCGSKITIPVAPECESLNAAAAAAIIIWVASRP